MVGLVIVSHSKSLAVAVRELAAAVGTTPIPIACAGGTGTDHAELGTDATEIMDALLEVDSPEGSVVLVDLGSAVLSTETALEFVGESLQGPVRLLSAPLVEGAVAAAVQIGLGAGLDTVVREASEALLGKRAHIDTDAELGVAPEEGVSLGARADAQAPGSSTAASLGARADAQAPGTGAAPGVAWEATRSVVVRNRHGLHARPAAQVVKIVGSFDAEVEIRNRTTGGAWVTARSLNRIATLGVLEKHVAEFRARGRDAQAVLDALERAAATCFGEPCAEVESPSAAGVESPTADLTRAGSASIVTGPGSGPASTIDTAHQLNGLPASDGWAVGPAFTFSIGEPQFGARAVQSAAEELQRFLSSAEALERQLRQEEERNRTAGAHDAAGIVEAHRLIVSDPDIVDAVSEEIGRGERAEVAAWRVAGTVAARFREASDEYLQQRAVDVLDVALRLVEILDADAVIRPRLPDEPAVLVADDIGPSVTMNLDPRSVLGIVTAAGARTTHAAIVARGLGIPAVVACPGSRSIRSGETVALDGSSGVVWVDPPAHIQAEIRARRLEWEKLREHRRAAARDPGRLADASAFPVLANIATAADAALAVSNGADGVGLLRTEFLFMGRAEAPTESEQVERLREMIAPFGDKPVTVRTLDIGGDKQVPFLHLPREENPFLGVRGIRLTLERRELFATHLRALLRAGEQSNVKLMLPMVADHSEIQAARALLEEAHRELEVAGTPHRWPVPVGIMVETPAAAWCARELARDVAFFSIGTNDLTQYVTAAERGGARLSYLTDGMHRSVARAIEATCAGAASAQIPVSVCGELGADASVVPALIGLGITSVSVNPAAVADIKALVSGLHREECEQAARAFLL